MCNNDMFRNIGPNIRHDSYRGPPIDIIANL